MKLFFIFLMLLVLWAFLAQSCMSFRIADIDAKQKFQQKGIDLVLKTAHVKEHAIHYAQSGLQDLPTLIFVHGTPGSWNAFMDYLQDKELLSKFRLISVDRPGFGFSEYGKVYNLATQSNILCNWIKQLQNGKPIYLIGHSLGGPPVLKMAADDPELFKGLVVISGSIDPYEEKPERWRVALFRTPLNYLVPGAFRPSNEELWYLKKDLVHLKNDYAKIHIPVYFIHGDKDTWVPPGNVAFGKKMLVNAPEIGELMLPGGNHFIPWTKFNEIRDVLVTLN